MLSDPIITAIPMFTLVIFIFSYLSVSFAAAAFDYSSVYLPGFSRGSRLTLIFDNVFLVCISFNTVAIVATFNEFSIILLYLSKYHRVAKISQSSLKMLARFLDGSYYCLDKRAKRVTAKY